MQGRPSCQPPPGTPDTRVALHAIVKLEVEASAQIVTPAPRRPGRAFSSARRARP